MKALARSLPFDPEGLHGLSARLMLSHHQNNYGGAVSRLNAIRDRIAGLTAGQADGFVLNGLKREELLATNSMLLHELYFASLGGGGEAMTPAMSLALDASFGSAKRWREEFTAMGRALGGGSGWVLLMFQPRDGSLVNQWAADHGHVLAAGVPILALDMYEHAYHMDFGAAATDYVETYMANVDWAKAHGRYQRAVHAASDEASASPEETGQALWIDVRRKGTFEQAKSMIPGAVWRDPGQAASWASEFPDDRELIVYCVHGHEVSQATALRLQAAGLNARYLHGGIDGWRAAGRPLAPK